MTGFEAPGTGVLLDFSGTPYDGLEVTVDGVSLELMLDIMEAYSAATEGGGEAGTADNLAALAKVLAMFSRCLESWNLTRRGEPVPATYDGLLSLDTMFVLKLIHTWISRTTQAAPDLGKDSPSGGTSPEELAAMAALSSSLPSSGPQNL